MGMVLPRHFFYGIIIFTMLVSSVVGLLTLVRDGGVGDGSEAVPGLMSSERITEFNRTFNKADNVTSNVEELKTKMQGLNIEKTTDIISLPLALVSTSWSMIKFITNSFGFMTSAFEGLSAYLGVPTWIPTLISLLVVVLFVFSILTIIFGKDT